MSVDEKYLKAIRNRLKFLDENIERQSSERELLSRLLVEAVGQGREVPAPSAKMLQAVRRSVMRRPAAEKKEHDSRLVNRQTLTDIVRELAAKRKEFTSSEARQYAKEKGYVFSPNYAESIQIGAAVKGCAKRGELKRLSLGRYKRTS